MDELIFFALIGLAVLVVIVVVIVRIILHFFGGRNRNHNQTDPVLRIALSKDDFIAQAYGVLGCGLLGIFLYNINLRAGGVISWITIIFTTSVLTLIYGYYNKLVVVTSLGLISLLVWLGAYGGEFAYNAQTQPLAVGVLLVLLGGLIYILGSFHRSNPKMIRFTNAYSILSLILITAVLFFISNQEGLRVLQSALEGKPFYGSFGISLILLIQLALAGIGIAWSLKHKSMSLMETVASSALIIFFLSFLFYPSNLEFFPSYRNYYVPYSGTNLTSAGILTSLLYNIMLLIFLVGIIYSGYIKQESWRVNFGAWLLFLLIIVKYFDWFYSFMDKSIFFIGAGLILFVVGYSMEKARKRVLTLINIPTPNAVQSKI